MFRKLNTVAALFLFSLQAMAQIGGRNSFDFLNQPTNARTAGVGGVNVTLYDTDANMQFANPALLNGQMHQYLGVNYNPYQAGINQTTLAYAHKLSEAGTVGAGFIYCNYGNLQGFDANGNPTNDFSASDYAISLSYAHKVSNFRLGGTLKLAGSAIEAYSAQALAVDAGAVFRHPTKDLTIGLAVKNTGFALSRFTPETPINLPLNVQMGISYKLEHMPLRFSVTAQHLQQWDIVYADPKRNVKLDENGNPIIEKVTFTDKLARHFVVGGEFLLTKNFNLRFGYNHLRRKELKLDNVSGGAGYSLGFMARIKAFELAYTHAFYHTAGGSSYLTLIINTAKLFKKQETQTGS